MKTIYTILFICIVYTSSAQDNFVIGTKAGIVIGSEEQGSGYAYGLDLQKHLGLGIYGVASFDAVQVELGDSYSTENLNENSIYQASSMGQFLAFGLGLRKRIKVSSKGSMSLQFSGQWVTQNRVDWDLYTDDKGLLNLYESQETYTRRTDLGYSISGQYLHRINPVLSLGLFAGYQSQPQLIIAGIRALVWVGKAENEEPNSTTTMMKNYLGIRMGAMAGDGTNQVINYTLFYGRRMNKKLALYGKYSIGQGIDDSFTAQLEDRASAEDIARYDQLFLSEDNEAGTIFLESTQSVAFGAGVKYQINSDRNSVLSLSGGISYFMLSESRLLGFSSNIVGVSEQFDSYREFMPEIGLHYDYNLSDFFFFGGYTEFAFNRLNFDIGLHVGLRF